ncbi:hypothetical protein ADK74_24085 [Streptomyces decoyicus]|nr:hypothetical protein ADK74_24085 [Streptomyces decoyicus]
MFIAQVTLVGRMCEEDRRDGHVRLTCGTSMPDGHVGRTPVPHVGRLTCRTADVSDGDVSDGDASDEYG